MSASKPMIINEEKTFIESEIELISLDLQEIIKVKNSCTKEFLNISDRPEVVEWCWFMFNYRSTRNSGRNKPFFLAPVVGRRPFGPPALKQKTKMVVLTP